MACALLYYKIVIIIMYEEILLLFISKYFYIMTAYVQSNKRVLYNFKLSSLL